MLHVQVIGVTMNARCDKVTMQERGSRPAGGCCRHRGLAVLAGAVLIWRTPPRLSGDDICWLL